MADLDVVPKRRTLWLVWLVLAIVVVAIVWYVLSRPTSTRIGGLVRPSPSMMTVHRH